MKFATECSSYTSQESRSNLCWKDAGRYLFVLLKTVFDWRMHYLTSITQVRERSANSVRVF